MFVMIPDIISEPVKRSVITVSFLLESVPQIVFRNKVGRARMQTSSEEATHDEVDEWSPSKVPDEEAIEGELKDKTERMPFGQALGAREGRTDSVKYDLKCSLIGIGKTKVKWKR